MKKLLFLSITLLLQVVNAEDFKRVIKDETHETQVALDLDTVRCSAIGYGMEELKVTLPSLKWYAVLDHSNQDGLGPCITAGTKFCLAPWNRGDTEPDPFPTVLINPDQVYEEISVRVILTEIFSKGQQDGQELCHRFLKEEVETEIRGIPFTHVRTKNIGTLPVQECDRPSL